MGLLDSLEALDGDALRRTFPIGIGSLWESATHMYGAESGWLGVLEASADRDFEFDTAFAGLGELREAWGELDSDWDEFLGSQDNESWDRVIVRESSVRQMTYRFTVLDVSLHVCTHAVHTIAQCRNMIRGCGVEEQALNDLIFYADERLRLSEAER